MKSESSNNDLYELINNLKFPLSCIVVVIHCFGTPLWSIFAVPTFFVISGFLFFRNCEGCGNVSYYKNKWHNRLYSLIIPYIIWNILWVLYLAAKNRASIIEILADNGYWHIFWDSNEWGHGGKGLFSLSDATYFPIYGLLWYIRELIICSMVAPLIAMLLEKLKFTSVLIFGIIFL